MSWLVVSLVEALGALRARYAHLCHERERERRGFAQKIEAAKDALVRHEVEDRDRLEEIGRLVVETERLELELATALRERDEARRLLPVAKADEPSTPVEAGRSS